MLDAGCGSAACLIRFLNTTGCAGLGIDIDETALSQGRDAAADLIQTDRLKLSNADLGQAAIKNADYAAAICLGSNHAFADKEQAFPVTLERLRNSISAGG